MRFSPFLLLCFLFLYSHFLSAQWLPLANNRSLIDVIVTDQNRIIITQPSNYSEPGETIYSDNGGTTWNPLKVNSTGQPLRLRLLGKQGNKLFGTSNTGIWTSSDNGNSWQLSPTPSPVYYDRFKASDKCSVFITDEDQGEMSISSDNGKTWTPTRIEASGPVSGVDVWSDTVFVSTRYKGAFKGTYSNSKWNWVNISTGGELTGIAAIGPDAYITTSTDRGAVIYRGKEVEKLILKNREGGIESRLENVFILGNYWVITTHKTSGKIFVSSDQGVSWKDFSGGLPKPYITETAYREVIISKVVASKDTLYAAGNQRLMKRPLNELAANYLETATDLKIDTLKRNTHVLSWTDNSSDEAGFIIERSQTGPAVFKEVGKVPANVERFTDYDLPGGLTYYYRIKSYNSNTSSRYSETLVVNREANVCSVIEKVVYTGGFSSLKFINEKTGFWLRSNSHEPSYLDQASYLLRTDDGGLSWKEVTFSMKIPAGSEIKFLDDRVGFIYHFPSFSDDSGKFMTVDGGLTWRKVDNNHKLFMEKFKILRKTIALDQFFVNDSTGFRGNNTSTSFARTTDYGRSWTPMKIEPDSYSESVKKVFFADSKNGFAIYSGKIGLTTDGGNTWASATIPKEFFNFTDIYSPDRKTIYFIGNIDYYIPGILKTQDNGKTFELIKFSLNGNANILDMSFIGNKAWLTTDAGELYVSDDNLKSWQILNERISFYESLFSFKGKWGLTGTDYSSSHKDEFLTYITYDGGRSWRDIKFPSKNTNLYGPPRVKVFDENKGIVLNEEVLYKTEDRGKTWTTIAQPFSQKTGALINNFYTVSEKVWFLGHRYFNEDYKLYKTTDGGNTWQHLPGVSNPFGSFYFFENIGFLWASGTGMHRTTDGGATWRNFSVNNDRFFRPGGIWFTNSTTGFMTGEGFNGDSYVPKIFRTKDGGNTWEDVVLGTAINGKRGLGSIKFFNEKVGYANFTGGEIIKTSDGGLTWTITTDVKFFAEYAGLIDFDNYYSYHDSGGKLYHFEPVSTAAKPHQPNGDIDACLYSNASTLYSVDNNDTYSYEWKLSGGGNLSVDRNEAKIEWTQLGTFKVSVRAINNCGVSEWQEIPVKVNSLPAKPTLVSGDLNPCPQANEVYQLSNTLGYTYVWKIPANASNTINKNSASITWLQENQTFVLKAASYDNVCYSDTLSIEVKTKSLPPVPTIITGTGLTSSSAVNNQWLFWDKPIAGATQQTLTPEASGSYSVQVSNECGTRKSAQMYVFIQILATEQEDNMIVLYPNPVSNELIIKGKQSQIQSIYLYDADGRLVQTKSEESASEYKMNVMDLSSGVYLIKIVTTDQVISRKVVIQR